MNVNRQQLIDVLTKLKPGLASKDIVEQNVCFGFHDDKIITFNDNILINFPFRTGIIGGVRANEVYSLINKIPSEELDIFTEGTEFRIVANEIEAGISMIEFTYPTTTPEKNWSIITSGLVDAIKLVSDHVSDNMIRPKFTCVHIKGDLVVASDGYKIMTVELPTKVPFDFLFPGSAAKDLTKNNYEFSNIAIDDNWIHLKNESGLELSIRQPDVEFFDDEQIARYMTVEGISLRLPDLTETINRCLLMINQDIKMEAILSLHFSSGKLLCEGRKDVGWIKEELELEYSGEPFVIKINPYSLDKIIRYTDMVIVGEDRCLFIGRNFKQVMVLAGD